MGIVSAGSRHATVPIMHTRTVPDLTLHDLRHFYAQQLTDAGRPEVSVQYSLRHSDPRTARRYTRQRDRGENAQKMDEILFLLGEQGVAKGA